MRGEVMVLLRNSSFLVKTWLLDLQAMDIWNSD